MGKENYFTLMDKNMSETFHIIKDMAMENLLHSMVNMLVTGGMANFMVKDC